MREAVIESIDALADAAPGGAEALATPRGSRRRSR